jgi:hypothetical protein
MEVVFHILIFLKSGLYSSPTNVTKHVFLISSYLSHLPVRLFSRKVNGHVSMLLKVFKVGKNWNHQDRLRETMINNSLAVCPLYLLFKDHKGWNWGKGAPPTRPVASGNRGMNLHQFWSR